MTFNVKFAALMLPVYLGVSELVEYLFGKMGDGPAVSTLIFLVSMLLLAACVYYLVGIFRKSNGAHSGDAEAEQRRLRSRSIALALIPAIFLSSFLVEALSLVPGSGQLVFRLAIETVGYIATCALFVYIMRLRSAGDEVQPN
ncbi:hypothetical protein D2E65_09295 [Mycobacteroides abscessus]|uniref:hypothetical protein n=1 Tax=Mycobacteroides abscessus TaxID=36809 RepID=UPI000C2575CE|nr:hypothetical protein [Mycobacteroides abscessus]RIR81946.1 hypothetical protein D2E65_09295 [Mycobacteroides abscessus]